MKKKVDFTVRDEGTVVLITPLSKAAKKWTAENVHIESWQWSGNGFGVARRYADRLIAGMESALFGIR